MPNNIIRRLVARLRRDPSFQPTSTQLSLLLNNFAIDTEPRRSPTPVRFTSHAHRVEIYRERQTAGEELYSPADIHCPRENDARDDSDCDTGPSADDQTRGGPAD